MAAAEQGRGKGQEMGIVQTLFRALSAIARTWDFILSNGKPCRILGSRVT